MQVVVLANEAAREEFIGKKSGAGIQVTFIETLSGISIGPSADAYFILDDDLQLHAELFSGKPVLINSTIKTLKELGLPENFIRINGWPGFLNRDIFEVVTVDEVSVKDIFNKLEWKYIPVKDEPGMVSARIISMIINEAYFALGEGVSTKDEIDQAMKLGTNYPYGPFEWSKKIGLEKIYTLLEKLSRTDKRYAVAPALKNEL